MEKELVLTIQETGQKIACPSTEVEPYGTSYVRILRPDGTEEAYYHSEEWREDPQGVMGAIIGALATPEGELTIG